MHFNFFPTFVAIQRCIFPRLVECIAIKQLVHPDGRVLVNLLPLCAAHERKKVFENLNEISERLLQYLCKWVATRWNLMQPGFLTAYNERVTRGIFESRGRRNALMSSIIHTSNTCAANKIFLPLIYIYIYIIISRYKILTMGNLCISAARNNEARIVEV